MKHSFLNNLFSGILILVLAFGLISCNENSTNADDEAALMYDGEEFTLGWGEIYDYGELNDGYRNYDFIIFETQEDTVSDEYNSNHAIYMWLESYGASSFDQGTYVYSDEYIEDNFIYEADINFLSADSVEHYYEVTSGEVEVSKSGSTFTLVFDLTFENDKTLTGSFSYDFEIYDESEDETEKASANTVKPIRFR